MKLMSRCRNKVVLGNQGLFRRLQSCRVSLAKQHAVRRHVKRIYDDNQNGNRILQAIEQEFHTPRPTMLNLICIGLQSSCCAVWVLVSLNCQLDTEIMCSRSTYYLFHPRLLPNAKLNRLSFSWRSKICSFSQSICAEHFFSSFREREPILRATMSSAFKLLIHYTFLPPPTQNDRAIHENR